MNVGIIKKKENLTLFAVFSLYLREDCKYQEKDYITITTLLAQKDMQLCYFHSECFSEIYTRTSCIYLGKWVIFNQITHIFFKFSKIFVKILSQMFENYT